MRPTRPAKGVERPVPDLLPAAGNGPVPAVLTGRERIALTCVALGLTQQAAARRLGSSERTLRRALDTAIVRLRAHSAAHAVALAAVSGQIDLTAVQARRLPAWPADHQPRRPRAKRLGRAERQREFDLLRGQNVAIVDAAVRVGLARNTGYTYESRRKRLAHGTTEPRASSAGRAGQPGGDLR